ncbi:NADP-dependent oxidoreductase domain-containing protein [Pelagophyceae sp. CCMP2097]|nr:NADP-dependent oxidoreductase domain-containing protein [Pelagophyceae sp. CCMP2097]
MAARLLVASALVALARGLIAPRRSAASGRSHNKRRVATFASKDADVRRILEERARKSAAGGPAKSAAPAARPSPGAPRTPAARGSASTPPGARARPPPSLFAGEARPERAVKPETRDVSEDYWGALTVAHRLGASTAAWGVEADGWSTKKKKAAGAFGVDDASAAFATLTAGGVELWEAAAGSDGAQVLGRVSKAAGLDVPQLAVRVAPGPGAKLLRLLQQPWASRDGVADVSTAAKKYKKLRRPDVVLVGPHSGGYYNRYVLPQMSAGFGLGAAAQKAVEAQNAETDDESTTDVGIANVRGGKALRRAHADLERRGLRLVAASLSFSLLDAAALRDGTFEAARDLDVTILARSPLAAGLCSGKCTAADPTGGAGFGVQPKWRYRALNRLKPLHDALAAVAVSAGKRQQAPVTPTQVALQWVIAKGAVPLPAVKTEAHAVEVVGCQGWSLTPEEVDTLDAARPRKLPAWPMLPR